LFVLAAIASVLLMTGKGAAATQGWDIDRCGAGSWRPQQHLRLPQARAIGDKLAQVRVFLSREAPPRGHRALQLAQTLT
jgi:hypothetical protein